MNCMVSAYAPRKKHTQIPYIAATMVAVCEAPNLKTFLPRSAHTQFIIPNIVFWNLIVCILSSTIVDRIKVEKSLQFASAIFFYIGNLLQRFIRAESTWSFARKVERKALHRD